MTSAYIANEVWCPHVTVACVIADGPRFLMVEEEVNGRLVYNQPAGHLEEHESLAAAAVRETWEETGWKVALTCLVGVHQWHSPQHHTQIVRFSFAAQTLSHDPKQALDPDIRRTLWLTREEIVQMQACLRSPLVLKSIDAWLTGQRLPLHIIESLLPEASQP